MASKITVIGAGSVGATIAYTLSQKNYVSEIVLIDINKNKVFGEAMDISQGTAFRDPISIVPGEYEDAKGSNIVVITSGVPRKDGQSRTELAQVNANIMKDIAGKIVPVAPDALYLIVANPVDVMTYAFLKTSKLPDSQVIGTGTVLDTARLRFELSKKLEVSQKNIHAYVFGEHGDSSFVPWSCVNISGVPFLDYRLATRSVDNGEPLIDLDEIEEYVHQSGAEIIKKKGATFYGIAITVEKLCALLSASFDSIATVTTMMHGEYGISGVCTSCLTLIGPKGVKGKLEVELNEKEIGKLKESTKMLKKVLDSLTL